MSKPAIQLAPERHAQLKAIATAYGLTITELIARFINSEIEAGTISRGFAGVNIQPHADGLMIGFDDQPQVKFSKESAANLAVALREFADSGKRAEKVFNMKHNYMIERKGTGVKLTIPMTGKVTKSWSHDIAREVADLVAM